MTATGKLIGYARVWTRHQSTDRQIVDLAAAGVRRDDLYVDHGVSGARARRPEFDRALDALHAGDTLVITTLDRLGRSTTNMLTLAEDLRARGAALCVLNLGGASMDTSTATGAMIITVMAALAQMELEIKRERITDSVTEPPAKTSAAADPNTQTAKSATPTDSSPPANPPARSPATSACPAPPSTSASRLSPERPTSRTDLTWTGSGTGPPRRSSTPT